jgi:hypothetical protein
MPKKKKDELTADELPIENLSAEESATEDPVPEEPVPETAPDVSEPVADDVPDDDLAARMLADYAVSAPPREIDAPETGETAAEDAELDGGEMRAAVQSPVKAEQKQLAPRKKSLRELNLNELDRGLSPEERQEWSSLYASYDSRSIVGGVVIGADTHTIEVMNLETGKLEAKTLTSLVVIAHRVKVLIPETELWMPGEARPPHITRNMVGSRIDFIVLEIDRVGGVAIGSRRAALAVQRRIFARTRHGKGELLKCTILAVGAKQCSVTCDGFDFRFTQRDLSFTAIADLRARYRPGQALDCRVEDFDVNTGQLRISVKDTLSNPFIDADTRHPPDCRRTAVISGKYAGGVFCTLPDDTVCLCHYSARHADADFRVGDTVILTITRFDYRRELMYGKILAKW